MINDYYPESKGAFGEAGSYATRSGSVLSPKRYFTHGKANRAPVTQVGDDVRGQRPDHQAGPRNTSTKRPTLKIMFLMLPMLSQKT